MPLFTLAVEGRPVPVLAQQNLGRAEKLVTSAIAPDLAELEEAGRPVWNGESELTVRNASPDETSRWERAFAQAIAEGEAAEGDRDGFAVFLIAVEEAGGEEDESEG
ncbi:hypothetical protein [Caldovatus aquaticus]|uniref:Uncharacterized protein n=1 Tax=Caldovatus aquaticus TaxID=2865671 RepID=A0ABS7F015_9PROT|nr:hypothetical protein [Caldovatus aquaticus]MBW8268966.1 hypothetical protein [Caldovatus aquaticus]